MNKMKMEIKEFNGKKFQEKLSLSKNKGRINEEVNKKGKFNQSLSKKNTKSCQIN